MNTTLEANSDTDFGASARLDSEEPLFASDIAPPAGAPTIASRILCGTDFTPGAAAAADVAQILATRLGIPLELVNIVDEGWMDFLPEHIHVAAGKARATKLREEKARLSTRGGSVVAAFHSGTADESLVEMGRDPGTELLVLSALGRRKSSEWRIGATAERVAKSAVVPTLVVRAAWPFESWASGKQTLKILVGVDFSAASDAALDWVRKLWHLGRCEVVAVHAAWPQEQRARSGETFPALPGVDRQRLQRIFEQELQAKLGVPVPGEGAHVRIQPEWDRVDLGLVRMADEEHANLIVIGTHSRHGLSRLRHGSVSRGVLHSALVNVCCVPATRESSGSAMERLPVLKRVLAATDLSDAGNLAIPYAFSVVQNRGAVCLVYVMPPFEELNEHSLHARSLDLRTRKFGHTVESAAAALRALIPAEAHGRGIFTEIKVLEDRDAARTICDTADHFGAELVCLSRHAWTGLTRARLGSVTQEILSRTDRPTLIVPAQDQ